MDVILSGFIWQWVWLGAIIDHIKSVVCVVWLSVFVTICSVFYFVNNLLEWIKFSAVLFVQQYHFIKQWSSYLVCFAACNNMFTLFSAVMFQGVSYIKVFLHIFLGGLLGLFFTDSGNDGSKTTNNLGYLFTSVVYLSYTTLMPAVMRCKHWFFCCRLMGFKLVSLQ